MILMMIALVCAAVASGAAAFYPARALAPRIGNLGAYLLGWLIGAVIGIVGGMAATLGVGFLLVPEGSGFDSVFARSMGLGMLGGMVVPAVCLWWLRRKVTAVRK